MTTQPAEKGPWETESGLIDDVDAHIVNSHFGTKEEYAQAVVENSGGEQKGVMLLFDLADDNGEVIGNQGFSIGTGWTVSEDGMTISHAKRKNVVTGTLYGQLQNQVIKNLGVDMTALGLPTNASVWNNLNFHWMQVQHATVGGESKSGLMPTIYLGVFGEETAPAPAPAAAKAAPAAAAKPVAKPAAAPKTAAVPAGRAALEAAALEIVAQTGTVREFVLKAMKLTGIADDEAFMNHVLDDSPKGFYKTHKGK